MQLGLFRAKWFELGLLRDLINTISQSNEDVGESSGYVWENEGDLCQINLQLLPTCKCTTKQRTREKVILQFGNFLS